MTWPVCNGHDLAGIITSAEIYVGPGFFIIESYFRPLWKSIPNANICHKANYLHIISQFSYPLYV